MSATLQSAEDPALKDHHCAWRGIRYLYVPAGLEAGPIVLCAAAPAGNPELVLNVDNARALNIAVRWSRSGDPGQSEKSGNEENR